MATIPQIPDYRLWRSGVLPWTVAPGRTAVPCRVIETAWGTLRVTRSSRGYSAWIDDCGVMEKAPSLAGAMNEIRKCWERTATRREWAIRWIAAAGGVGDVGAAEVEEALRGAPSADLLERFDLVVRAEIAKTSAIRGGGWSPPETDEYMAQATRRDRMMDVMCALRHQAALAGTA